ncbi:MAG: SigE family RNA polymerase sigma factor [Actinobacteria bacterium]|nr:SigE family RNA polymerase sigma factor [Actinomycetota bacterium]
MAGPEGHERGGGSPLAVVRPEPTAAFDELYRSEWSGLVALGWSLTGRWSVAEELAQDAFADAYRGWDRVGGLERPGAWLRRAVVNRAASHHRHRHVEDRGLARLDARDGAGAGASGDDPTGDAAASRVGDPAFWDAVRALPDRQAACVALHYLEDRSVAEIAEVLGCRAATVKVHLHRGRTALARSLGEPADEPGPGDRRTTHQGEEDR